MFSEIRQRFRALGCQPAYSIVVLLTLGVGIGASAAVFIGYARKGAF
jgi:hypothetical protein